MKTIRVCLVLLLAPVCAFAGGLTIDEVIAHRALWPTEVKLVAATRGTVMKDGKPGGVRGNAMLLGAGGMLTVLDITKETVTGRLGGTVVEVPAAKTDLLQRISGVELPEPPRASAPAAPRSTPGAAKETPAASTMQRMLAGKLVHYRGGQLANVDASALDGVKYYALYYSASWCGPCRQFTPGFIREYAKIKAAHPEFEAVFLSGDRSAGAMLEYMRDDKMPWPAVKFDERNDQLMRYSGPGIPCLVLVDAEGKVLADSFVNGNYVGPNSVLEKTKRLLKM